MADGAVEMICLQRIWIRWFWRWRDLGAVYLASSWPWKGSTASMSACHCWPWRRSMADMMRTVWLWVVPTHWTFIVLIITYSKPNMQDPTQLWVVHDRLDHRKIEQSFEFISGKANTKPWVSWLSWSTRAASGDTRWCCRDERKHKMVRERTVAAITIFLFPFFLADPMGALLSYYLLSWSWCWSPGLPQADCFSFGVLLFSGSQSIYGRADNSGRQGLIGPSGPAQ